MTEEVLNDNLNDDQKITDEVILQLKPLSFKTITDDDIIKFIHLQCQKVLELAKTKNDSKEVARAFSLICLTTEYLPWNACQPRSRFAVRTAQG